MSKSKPPKKTEYTFLIYAKYEPRIFQGILGTIHLQHISLLLSGGRYLIRETYDGSDPVEWYTKVLEEQSIVIKASKKQSYKGQNYIWLQVDEEKTPIHEYIMWEEVAEGDLDTLAWRHVYYPCSEAGAECIGLSCAAKDICLTEPHKPELMMKDVLDAVLGP